MNKQGLKKISGISSASIAKLGKGGNIITDVLLKICEALECGISDIMEVVRESSESTTSKRGTANCIKKSARYKMVR